MWDVGHVDSVEEASEAVLYRQKGKGREVCQ